MIHQPDGSWEYIEVPDATPEGWEVGDVKDTSGKPIIDALMEAGEMWFVDTPWGRKSFQTEQEAREWAEQYISDKLKWANHVGPGIAAVGAGCAVKYALDHPEEAMKAYAALRHLVEPVVHMVGETVKGVGGIVPG
jgi:hypothetical protein